MKVGHLNVTRPMWYDRTPGTKVLGFVGDGVNGGVGGTFRFLYTVPSGRKAYLDMAECSLIQMTHFSSGTFAVADIFVSAGGQEWVVLQQRNYANIPGSGGADFAAAFGALVAGDFTEGLDASDTNQTYNVRLNVKITEFDA